MRKRMNNYVKLSRKIDGKEVPSPAPRRKIQVGDVVRVIGQDTTSQRLGDPSGYIGNEFTVYQESGDAYYLHHEAFLSYWYVAEDLELVT